MRFAFTYQKVIFILALSIAIFSCNKINLDPDAGNAPIVVPTPPNLTGQPNIVLILADDIGYEVPTCDGGQSYSTPTIDMMSQMGVRFTQCHATPLCSPSRFTLVTGKYNFRNYTTWGSMALTERTIGNLMHDAGYATCVAGKWQFDNGDKALKAFGYDKYCVWSAFKQGTEEGEELGTAYKSPTLYQNGAYLDSNLLAGQYGVDIFNQYISDFIDSNKSKPFFIYYPTPLCHYPYSPTPDDAEFASWPGGRGHSDTTFFPSMVKYLDKSVAFVLNKLKQAGVDKNTIVLFCGDNGTPQQIFSLFNGQLIQGGKSHTYDYGTHVPLIAYCPGSIPSGISTSMVDFTDFLPTMADLAHTKISSDFGTTDGVSFRDQMFNPQVHGRDWIYLSYNAHPDISPDRNFIYVQDSVYKLYEQIGFFNIGEDIYEKNQLHEDDLNKKQKEIKFTFHHIMDSIHK